MYKLGDEKAFNKMAMFINPKALELKNKNPLYDIYILVRFENMMPVDEVVWLMYNPLEHILTLPDKSMVAVVSDLYHWAKREHPMYTILVKLTPTYFNPHSCLRRENIQQL